MTERARKRTKTEEIKVLEAALAVVEEHAFKLRLERDRLARENSALREALEKIVDNEEQFRMAWVADVARAALVSERQPMIDGEEIARLRRIAEYDLLNDLSCLFFDAQTVKSVPSDYAKAAIVLVRNSDLKLTKSLEKANEVFASEQQI